MSTNAMNTAEDADMSECDGEKVVTMMDVLQEQEEFEEDANAVLGASDDKNCTYPKGYVKRQAIYACLTCCPEAKTDPTKRAGICLACSLTCHENHELLVELYTKRNFRCDCGNPKFNHPCQFTPNKTNLNYDNRYNQNFSGVYCICHRPYPDPEASDDEEMIQCIVCEDWLHTSHLEATVPLNDQYAEMVCKDCMEDNDFLQDYTHLVINTVDKEIVVTDPDLDVTDIINATVNGLEKANSNTEDKVEADKLEDNDTANLEKEEKMVEDSLSEAKPNESEDKTSKESNQESDINVKSAEPSTENPAEASSDPSMDSTSKIDSISKDESLHENKEQESEETSNGAVTSESTENKTDEKDSEEESEETSNGAVTSESTENKNDEKDSEEESEETSNGAVTSESTENKNDEKDSEEEKQTVDEDKDKQISDTEENEKQDKRDADIETSIEDESTTKTEDETKIKESTNGTSDVDSQSKKTEPIENGHENKRKLSTDTNDSPAKKPKLAETPCIRPRGVKHLFKGATFWPSNFRLKLCTCNECIAMYKDLAVLFLIDPDDTVTAYEALGKERTDGAPTSQYEKGLQALSSLDRVQQINALTEYNKMKDKLLDFLKSFKDRKEIVKEEDIKAFFAGMKPTREPDGVYFCR